MIRSIAKISATEPQGGSELSSEVLLDKDPTTSWTSAQYPGGLQGQIRLDVELATPAQINHMIITTPNEKASFEIYVIPVDGGTPTLAGHGTFRHGRNDIELDVVPVASHVIVEVSSLGEAERDGGAGVGAGPALTIQDIAVAGYNPENAIQPKVGGGAGASGSVTAPAPAP